MFNIGKARRQNSTLAFSANVRALNNRRRWPVQARAAASKALPEGAATAAENADTVYRKSRAAVGGPSTRELAELARRLA